MSAGKTVRRQVLATGSVWAALWSFGGWAIVSASAGAAEPALDTASLDETLRAIGGARPSATEIVLTLPDLSENGAFVPVTVTSSVPGASEISIFVSSNPRPLVARFTIPEGTEAFVSTRVKMADSGRVYAVVKADGQSFAAFKDIKVMVGGCA